MPQLEYDDSRPIPEVVNEPTVHEHMKSFIETSAIEFMALVDELDKREQDVLIQSCVLNRTQVQIAHTLGCSQPTVCRVMHNAVRAFGLLLMEEHAY